MISIDTLPQFLTQLGFAKHGASYSKTIGTATLKVDTQAQRITYPDGLIVNGEFTCNFSSAENFVVLECVHRLLEKGYKAEHIQLEPKWKLGHGASGGRADILVTDHQKKPLLIIECKTAGREFDKAWRNTLQDGDQLFSYAQQISETQFLCLYASDFDNGVVSYQSHIIAHRDNEKYLADNPNFKSFAEVSDVKSRYTVWRDTYKLDYTSKGIFEGNIQPYHIGKDKYAGVAVDDYASLLQGQPNATLMAHDTFAQYRKAFDASREIVNLNNQRAFKAKPAAEQQAELEKRLLAFVQSIERDKLYHFVMASDQPNSVLVIRSPNDNKAQKQFLGYEWSSAKGNEGIQITKDANGHHLTPLYDETNRNNAEKINSLIAANFQIVGAQFIAPALCEFASSVRLVDMLDFSRVAFEKQITITSRKTVTIQAKWPLIKLEDVAEIKSGGTPSTKNPNFWEGGGIPWATLVDTKEKYLTNTQRKITSAGLKHSTLLPVNTVIFSSRATIGEVCINKVPTATNQGYKNFICDPAKIDYEFLYYVLVHYRDKFENLVPSGSKYKEINTTAISEFAIPLPPLDVQQQIVAECEAVDAEVAAAQASIATARTQVEVVAGKTFTKYPLKKLGQVCEKPEYGAAEKAIEGNPKLDYRYIRITDINENGLLNNDFKTAEKVESKYILQEGDFLFARSGNTVGKTFLYQQTFGKAMYAGYLIRFRPHPEILYPAFLALVTRSKNYREWVARSQTGAGQPNINGKIYSSLQIPVPPLAEQQKLVAEVEALERDIASAQAVIAAAPAKKQAIMQRYL